MARTPNYKFERLERERAESGEEGGASRSEEGESGPEEARKG